MARNPQDLTTRNIRAVNKKLAKLAAKIEAVKARLKTIENSLSIPLLQC